MQSENVKMNSEVLKELRKYLMRYALQNNKSICGSLRTTVDQAVIEYMENHPIKK